MKFKYGDVVKVIDGFYQTRLGTVVDFIGEQNLNGDITRIHFYTIELFCGKTINEQEKNIERNYND